MCGRYGRMTAAGVFAEMIGARVSERLDDRPGYNQAPGLIHPIALRSPDSGDLVVGPAWWGFLPGWARKTKLQQVNARSESAAEKPMFKKAFHHQRCAIPLDWWIEWQRSKTPSQPYALRPSAATADELSHGPFFLAGLWTKAPSIDDFDGAGQVSYAILTKAPHDDISFVHDRQPVTLTSEATKTWLSDTDDHATLAGVIDGGDFSSHDAWPISPRVGDVRNQGPELVERVELS